MSEVHRLLIYCHSIKLQHGRVNMTVYERRILAALEENNACLACVPQV